MAPYAHARPKRTLLTARHPPLPTRRLCPTHAEPARQIALALLHGQCAVSQPTLQLSLWHSPLVGHQHGEGCWRAHLYLRLSPTRLPLGLPAVGRYGHTSEPRGGQLPPALRAGADTQLRLCLGEEYAATRAGETLCRHQASSRHKRERLLHGCRCHLGVASVAAHCLCLVP